MLEVGMRSIRSVSLVGPVTLLDKQLRREDMWRSAFHIFIVLSDENEIPTPTLFPPQIPRNPPPFLRLTILTSHTWPEVLSGGPIIYQGRARWFQLRSQARSQSLTVHQQLTEEVS